MGFGQPGDRGACATITKRRAVLTISVALALATSVLALAGVDLRASASHARVRSAIDAGSLGPRILVIVPHPDDETLGAGGAIHALVRSGAQVRIVIVTAGDAYLHAAQALRKGRVNAAVYRDLGQIRHAEALKAASALGLKSSDVVCLGFADGSTNTLWDTAWDGAHLHVGRNGARRIPYRWAYRPGQPQCGQQLTSDLVAIVKDFAPTAVIGPDADEVHHDHWATAALVTYALDDSDYQGQRLTFVVHFPWYPFPPVRAPRSLLTLPASLTRIGLGWHSLALNAADEASKERAVDAYRSQIAIPYANLFMHAFVRRNELFAKRATPSIARAATDAMPADGATGTVSVMPRGTPVLAWLKDLAGGGTDIVSVRLVRGPSRLWVGLRCARSAAPLGNFRVGIRFIGGSAAPQRLDLVVDRGTVIARRVTNDSIQPDGLTAGTHGTTMWISMPAAVLDGRTTCMIGAAGGSARLTVWRDAGVASAGS